jgi:hypothetical protein
MESTLSAEEFLIVTIAAARQKIKNRQLWKFQEELR